MSTHRPYSPRSAVVDHTAAAAVSPSGTITNVRLLLIAFAFLALWFGVLDYRRLANPDEGRYAEIPREMVITGDWITPRLNGIKYFEKPPLQYWITAAAYRAFGFSEWTTRLWPALAGMLGILLTGWMAHRLYGRSAGWYASLVLLSSFYYVAFSHIATLDMGLTLFLTAALAAFVHAQQTAEHRRRRLSMLAAWAAMGFAVLSKGLIGIALPALALIVYCLAQRDFTAIRRLSPVAGMLILLTICAPWFIAVSLANPEFPYFFFVHEHFDRYTSNVHNRSGPLWYFLPILVLAILPWLSILTGAVRDCVRAQTSGGFNAARFFLCWGGTVLVFFSLSGSKLPGYILPLMPAAALLIAERLNRLDRDAVLRHAGLLSLLLATVLFIAAEILERTHFAKPFFPLYEGYGLWMEVASCVLFLGCGLVLWWRPARTVAIMLFASSGFAAGLITLTGFERLSPIYSGYQLAHAVGPFVNNETAVFSVGTYNQSLVPYLGRTVTLVAFQGEFAYGLRQEPQRHIPTLDEFEVVWRGSKNAIGIFEENLLYELTKRKLPMHEITRNSREIVITKP
ncbi:MAG: phospholipid carrier-dependent glycosyltransferase [Betaproteobacteria bacterium]|nr:phospholipid carrier-dependent glycosyltransferase [Betaproteobacteria bacterium]